MRDIITKARAASTLDTVRATRIRVATVQKDEIPDYLTEEIAESRFVPPQGAADEAQQALDWIDEHGRDEAEGATEEGLARARQIVEHVEDDEPMSPEFVKEISAFFARHSGNEDIAEEYEGEPWKDNGYLSWLLWGGDPAKSWADSLADRIDEVEDEEASD